MKKLKNIIAGIFILIPLLTSAQWIDASNTTVVGLTEKNTDSIMSIDGEGKMGYTLKSDINLSGFNNDLTASDIEFTPSDNIGASNVQAAIEEVYDNMTLQSITERGNKTTLPIFVNYLNVGGVATKYLEYLQGTQVFEQPSNQGITRDDTYYYISENFSITKRLISDNSIIDVKNNPAGGNRLGGIFYDETDDVLLVCAGSNTVGNTSAFVYRIDPDTLDDIEFENLTSEIPETTINAVFRINDKIYIGESLASIVGNKKIYRLNLSLEIEDVVYEDTKDWQDATIRDNEVFITDHSGGIHRFIVENNELNNVGYYYTGSLSAREGITHMNNDDFIIWINSSQGVVNAVLNNNLASPPNKVLLKGEGESNRALIEALNPDGMTTFRLLNNGRLGLGTNITTPNAPLHIRFLNAGEDTHHIRLQNSTNTESSMASIVGTLSSTNSAITGKISHHHFGSLGRGWSFWAASGSSAAERMRLLGDGRLLIGTTSLQGLGTARLQINGRAYVSSAPIDDEDVVRLMDLAEVAVSGDYNDLSNKPDIPPYLTIEDIEDVTQINFVRATVTDNEDGSVDVEFSVDWDDIGGDQSDINISGFTNDLSLNSLTDVDVDGGQANNDILAWSSGDGYFTPVSHIGQGGSAHPLATGSTAGFMSSELYDVVNGLKDFNPNSYAFVKFTQKSDLCITMNQDVISLLSGEKTFSAGEMNAIPYYEGELYFTLDDSGSPDIGFTLQIGDEPLGTGITHSLTTKSEALIYVKFNLYFTDSDTVYAKVEYQIINMDTGANLEYKVNLPTAIDITGETKELRLIATTSSGSGYTFCVAGGSLLKLK